MAQGVAEQGPQHPLASQTPNRGWCNRQHDRFWPCYWGFESSPPSSEAAPAGSEGPHRLVAEDTTLSRWRHGFESRWGCRGAAA